MTRLRDIPAARRIAAIGDAAQRWCDADFPPRVRATRALEARTGYTEPVIDIALDRLFGSLRADALQAAVVHELGSVAALDGPIATDGRPPAWARGVERVAIISSDTTIGVAIVPAAFALAAGCDVTVKDRADALVGAFFTTLADEHPAFAEAARARAWSGADDAPGDALLATADVVVAFGADDSLAAIRARCAPGATFVPFGHRASIGYLDAHAAAGGALLEGIARDALLYDGEGCLSLHALYVQDGRDLAAFGDALAAAFERAAIEFPAGVQRPGRSAAAAGYRNTAAFRAASGRGRVYRTADGAAALVLDAPAGEPPPFAPRTLPVVRAGDAGDVAAAVAAARLPVQALAVAEPGDPAAIALAARIGAVRVARFGTLQDPPASGHHGGRARIADFVRWIDGA